jgi:hypothetical protein
VAILQLKGKSVGSARRETREFVAKEIKRIDELALEMLNISVT